MNIFNLVVEKKIRKNIYVFILNAVLLSAMELITISSLMPVINIVLFENHSSQLFDYLNLDNINSLNINLIVVVVFSLMIVFLAYFRIIHLKKSLKLMHEIGLSINLRIYRIILNKKYLFFVNVSSNKIISLLTTDSRIVLNDVIWPFLNIITTSLVTISILGGLLFFDFQVTMFVMLSICLIYYLKLRLSNEILIKNSQNISDKSIKSLKIINESVGGIRDVLVNKLQGFYIKELETNEKELKVALISNQFIGMMPKYILESSGMILILVISTLMVIGGKDKNNVITSVGVLIFAIQRLIPIMQQLYISITQIKGARQSLREILDLLKQEKDNSVIEKSKLDFKNQIQFKNINFAYDKNKIIISDFNYEIKKGEKVGIIGKTGAGKSTLIDLFLGFLPSGSGCIEVDGVMLHEGNLSKWQNNVSIVPQSIFLADTSIIENIAFGMTKEEIDVELVKRVCKLALIDEFFASLSEGYETKIGERGVRLSGGQRQRIGIARALYSQKEILILDEATNALDAETEKEIMQNICSSDVSQTILIISHNHSTLDQCNKIIDLNQISYGHKQ